MTFGWSGRFSRPVGAAWLAALLAGCAVIPDAPRMLSLQDDRTVAASITPCNVQAAAPPVLSVPQALPGAPLRVVSWNIHKSGDAGWQADLGRYAREHHLLLLQEAVLTDEVRSVLEGAGHRWHMAGAFAFNGVERGVMTAANVGALSACTLRTFEPVTIIPKSALVSRYRVAGSTQALAVANVHGINFTLGLGSFGEQLNDIATELAAHEGPIILAGDFNGWSAARQQLMADVARKLRLEPARYDPDQRRRVFGFPLDHLFMRGLVVRRAGSVEVKSSDHNPILIEFAVP
jgi:endonuclease/exonuclease/phosphatase (EEP) superfamily protein YafD